LVQSERDRERIKTNKKNCENLQIGDPGRWRAMHCRVPGSESGVVHELMERVKDARAAGAVARFAAM